MMNAPTYIKGIKMVKRISHELREGISDTNDCVVFAVMHATGVPYRDAHAYVEKRFRRKALRGVHVTSPMLAIEVAKDTIFGYRVFNKPVATRIVRGRLSVGYKYETLSSVLLRCRTGRYIICSGSHAFTVIDGVVFDNDVAGARTQVREIYELVASSECEKAGR